MADEAQTPAQVTPKADESASATPAPAEPQKAEAAPAKPESSPERPESKEGEAQKTEGEQKPVEVKYELKIPEGSKLDAAAVEKTIEFAKANGLSNEQAQAILEREDESVAGYLKANAPGGEAWNKRLDDWEKTALANSEIGGTPENLKASAEYGRRALEKFFPESTKKFLNDTGFGSHPDLLLGFARIGRAMAEDTLVMPGSSTGSKLTVEEKFYGKKD